MSKRLRTHAKNKRIETPNFSTAPTQEMFQSRPMQVFAHSATQSQQQQDLKTSLMRALRYGHHLQRMHPVGVSTPQALQAKLTVGSPQDSYEQQADAVAARVVDRINQGGERSLAQALAPNPFGQRRKRNKSSASVDLNIQPLVQQESASSTQDGSPQLEQSIERHRGGGQPLSDQLREPMEQAFGADFSNVKVHTDAQSNMLNRSLNARAFTTEQDIFFRQGEYNPESRSGQELLAHELTHVVQQGQVSSLDTPVVQRVVFNEQKVTKSDIGSFLGGYGTVLAATINGSYVGKFAATRGGHAEQNFYNWVVNNWNQLIQDNQIQQNQANQIEIRITRSPCGPSFADCGQTLQYLRDFASNQGIALDLKLLMLSLYQNSQESTQVLQDLYNQNVEMGAWEVFDELDDKNAGIVEHAHLNADSLNELSNEHRQGSERRLDEVDETIHGRVAV